MPDSVHKSKVDAWLALLILALFLSGVISTGAGVYILAVGPFDAALTLLLSGPFLVALIVGLVWPVRYTLASEELIVQSGLLRSRYRYEILTGAAPSRNFLSSPALSLDRIKITYRGRIGFFMISPEDKQAFLRQLAERAPHLRFENGVVTSASEAR